MLITSQFKSLETLMQVMATAPRECVYGLINESDKKVQVYSTANFLSHLTRLVQELGSVNNQAIKEDLENIVLVVLETEFPNIESRNNKYKTWVAKYKSQGYEFYNDLSVVQYKVKESFRYKDRKAYYVVELVSRKGGKAILLGAFSKYREAREFQNKHYKEGIIGNVVYAENAETEIWKQDYV